MDKDDVQRLFNLIGTLYPGSKRIPKTKNDAEAWLLVLEPWSYEDAKQAVIDRARENRFPPDVSELTPYLPKLETQPEGQALPEPSPAHLEKFYIQAEALREKYRAMGIPSPSQAKKQGMTYAEWSALADQANRQEVSR